MAIAECSRWRSFWREQSDIKLPAGRFSVTNVRANPRGGTNLDAVGADQAAPTRNMLLSSLSSAHASRRCSRVSAALLTVVLLSACGDDGERSSGDGSAQPFFDDNGFPQALAELGFVDPGSMPTTLGDTGADGRHSGSNTSALLQGAVIGDGSRDNVALTETIPFQVDEVGLLRIVSVRRVDGGVVAIVRNADSRTRCGAALSGFRLLDANADALPESRLPSLVEGRAFAAASRGGIDGSESATCLAPGALAGILVTVTPGDQGVFALAASASGFVFDPADALVGLGIPAVVPLDYAVNADGVFAFRVVNKRAVTMDVRSATLVALDEDGLPLMYRFIPLPDFSLSAGEERLVTPELSLDFTGRTTSIRLFIDSR